jgi:hypothetical protein
MLPFSTTKRCFFCVFTVWPLLISAASAQVVDLLQRAEGTQVNAIAGSWTTYQPGYIYGVWELFGRGQYVTLTGQGYYQIRWELEYWQGDGSGGQIAMPTMTTVAGTNLHVASGGGHKMDDFSSATYTWFGNYYGAHESLPAGTPMIWQNEYYYLDGTVTITCNERLSGSPGYYNCGVAPNTWSAINTDINKTPSPSGSLRYGVSYDLSQPAPVIVPPQMPPAMSGQRNYYNFNETTGTTATDSWGGCNATLASGPIIPNGSAAATWGQGQLGGALVLDGGPQSYAILPSGVASDLHDCTFAAWVKVDAVHQGERIFDFGTDTTNYMFLTPCSTNNTVRFAIRSADDTSEQQINSSTLLAQGSWHHVAVTLLGNQGCLYIDGVLAGQNNSFTRDPSDLGITTCNYLGKSQTSTDFGFDGSIDELRIYDRALSAAEIATMVIPVPESATPLLFCLAAACVLLLQLRRKASGT